jgi:catechol 2,3-dioxygenase-like lactoylglutathione lyase family enzyme
MSTLLTAAPETASAALFGGVDFITILVKSERKALAFFTEVLGFENAGEAIFGEGQRMNTVRPAGGGTRIALYPDPHASHEEEQMGGGGCCGSGGCGSCGTDYAWTGVVLGTSDVRGAVQHLAGRGVTILQPPVERSWGVTDALFADPDGNVFNLVQGSF